MRGDRMTAWLMAIGKPPLWDEERTYRSKTDWRYETLCWIEERMLELDIIRRIRDDRYHKRALAYFDWLKEAQNETEARVAD